MSRKAYPIFLVAGALLAVALTLFLRQALRGPTTVHVGGAVEAAYDYPLENDDIAEVNAEGTLRSVTSKYTGVPVRELVGRSLPRPGAVLLLLRSTDGYAFFVSMAEVEENDSLLLAPQGEGEEASYDVVGAQNSKAWVRGVSEMLVIGAATLEVSGALERPAPFDPDDWQFEMDSVRLQVGDSPQKYQGVPLGKVLGSMAPLPAAETVILGTEGGPVTISLAEVLGDDDVRLFTVIEGDLVSFAVATMGGEVIAAPVGSIEVQ